MDQGLMHILALLLQAGSDDTFSDDQLAVDAKRNVVSVITNDLLASFRTIAFANLPRCQACGAQLALVSGCVAKCHSLLSLCLPASYAAFRSHGRDRALVSPGSASWFQGHFP